MSAPGERFVLGSALALGAWTLAVAAFAPPGGYDAAALLRSLQWCGAVYVGIAVLDAVVAAARGDA